MGKYKVLHPLISQGMHYYTLVLFSWIALPGTVNSRLIVCVYSNRIIRLNVGKKEVRISRAIVRARDSIPIVSTRQLAAVVTAAVRNVRTDKFSRQLHPAGRTFQALRWTNFSANLKQHINFFVLEGVLMWFLSRVRGLHCQTFLQRNAFRNELPAFENKS